MPKSGARRGVDIFVPLEGFDMMKALLAAVVLLPAPLLADDTATGDAPEVATRPGLAEGAEAPPPSDDLAECAAIIAVASSRANQRIQRERLEQAAGAWFAKAGDVAIAEGALPGEEVWGQKVASWAGQIGSIDALQRHGDWMEYCAVLGDRHGMALGGLNE